MKEVGEADPAPWSSVTDPSPHLPAPAGSASQRSARRISSRW